MFDNKAKFAANSRAIGQDFNAAIGYFRYEMQVHDSIRAFLAGDEYKTSREEKKVAKLKRQAEKDIHRTDYINFKPNKRGQ